MSMGCHYVPFERDLSESRRRSATVVRNPAEGAHGAKGNPVPIPEPGSGTVPMRALVTSARRGNPKRPGDAVGSSGESFLFSISVRVPWNPLAGR